LQPVSKDATTTTVVINAETGLIAECKRVTPGGVLVCAAKKGAIELGKLIVLDQTIEGIREAFRRWRESNPSAPK
jgi:hypothetical protein